MGSIMKLSVFTLHLISILGGISCQITGQCSDLRNERRFIANPSCSGEWQAAAYDQDTSEACKVCSKSLNDVAIALGKNDEDSARNLLYTICTKIVDYPRASECRALVTENMVEIKDLVRHAVNRWAVCGLLKMCQDTSNSPAPGPSSDAQNFKYAASSANDIPGCSDCQGFVSGIKESVSRAGTQTTQLAQLQQTLVTDLCIRLPLPSDVSECKELVASGLPKLLKTVADSIDPQALCQEAALCGQRPSVQQLSNSGSRYGKLCTQIANGVHQLGEGTIQSTLQTQICGNSSEKAGRVPCDVRRATTDFINALVDIIDMSDKCVEAVKASVSAGENIAQQQTQAARKDNSNQVCSICHWIVDLLSTTSAPSQSKGAITSFVDGLCNSISENVGSKSACDDFKARADLSDLADAALRPSVCSGIGC